MTRNGGSAPVLRDCRSVIGAYEPGWYALRVRAGREFTVERRLGERGLESFLPVYTEERRWSDRAMKISRPLFAGYLFARLETLDELRDALGLAEVFDVLPSRGNPQGIPDGEIDNVRRAADAAVAIEPCAYVAGEVVTVDAGPLAGVRGVVRRTTGATRIVIAIEILRRAVSVEIDAKDLKKKGKQ